MTAFFHTLSETIGRVVARHLRSLRGRLLYTLLGLLLVLIGLEFWTYHTQAALHDQNLRDEQRRAATATAAAFRANLDELYRSQQAVALALSSMGMPGGYAERYLESVR